jgi:porphyrinogen peroxidase
MNYQPGIIDDVPLSARYLVFDQRPDKKARDTIKALADEVDGRTCVVGLGETLLASLGVNVPGMQTFDGYHGSINVPSTRAALVCWLRDDDRGNTLHRSRRLIRLLKPAFRLVQDIEGFRYDIGRDLSGYEDGTENPEGDDALRTAFVRSDQAGFDGSSFLVLQQWQHDLDTFESMPTTRRDNIIGRRQSDNEELDDAPSSAHVKRTAQESFSPEAFMLRRSMPWNEGQRHGLMFAAFAASFYPFEAQMKRMIGMEDNVSDGLFEFSVPRTGSYLWCPPIHRGQLDLRLLDND